MQQEKRSVWGIPLQEVETIASQQFRWILGAPFLGTLCLLLLSTIPFHHRDTLIQSYLLGTGALMLFLASYRCKNDNWPILLALAGIPAIKIGVALCISPSVPFFLYCLIAGIAIPILLWRRDWRFLLILLGFPFIFIGSTVGFLGSVPALGSVLLGMVAFLSFMVPVVLMRKAWRRTLLGFGVLSLVLFLGALLQYRYLIAWQFSPAFLQHRFLLQWFDALAEASPWSLHPFYLGGIGYWSLLLLWGQTIISCRRTPYLQAEPSNDRIHALWSPLAIVLSIALCILPMNVPFWGNGLLLDGDRFSDIEPRKAVKLSKLVTTPFQSAYLVINGRVPSGAPHRDRINRFLERKYFNFWRSFPDAMLVLLAEDGLHFVKIRGSVDWRFERMLHPSGGLKMCAIPETFEPRLYGVRAEVALLKIPQTDGPFGARNYLVFGREIRGTQPINASMGKRVASEPVQHAIVLYPWMSKAPEYD